MLLEAEGREMDASSEDLGLGKNTDTADAVNLHFHVWVAVGVSKVGQMWSPCSVLGVALDDDGIFVQGVCKREGGLGFLP
jgi:hypothetical protein